MAYKTMLGLLLGAILLVACARSPQPTTGYPAPGEPGTPLPYPVPWEPQPGDEKMQRANVFIDKKEILTLESFPPQYRLHLVGSLPTPCHELRVVVGEPDNQSRINVDAYSLVDPNRACVQVLQPFDVNVSLGSYSAGNFTVWLNGEQIGVISP